MRRLRGLPEGVNTHRIPFTLYEGEWVLDFLSQPKSKSPWSGDGRANADACASLLIRRGACAKDEAGTPKGYPASHSSRSPSGGQPEQANAEALGSWWFRVLTRRGQRPHGDIRLLVRQVKCVLEAREYYRCYGTPPPLTPGGYRIEFHHSLGSPTVVAH